MLHAKDALAMSKKAHTPLHKMFEENAKEPIEKACELGLRNAVVSIDIDPIKTAFSRDEVWEIAEEFFGKQFGYEVVLMSDKKRVKLSW